MDIVEEEEILARESGVIMGRIKSVIGLKIGQSVFARVDAIIDESRQKLKRRYGIELPPIVAVILPSVGHVHLTRCDRENDYVERLIVNIVRSYPSIDRKEVAVAIAAAFPKYAPREQTAREQIEQACAIVARGSETTQ